MKGYECDCEHCREILRQQERMEYLWKIKMSKSDKTNSRAHTICLEQKIYSYIY